MPALMRPSTSPPTKVDATTAVRRIVVGTAKLHGVQESTSRSATAARAKAGLSSCRRYWRWTRWRLRGLTAVDPSADRRRDTGSDRLRTKRKDTVESGTPSSRGSLRGGSSELAVALGPGPRCSKWQLPDQFRAFPARADWRTGRKPENFGPYELRSTLPTWHRACGNAIQHAPKPARLHPGRATGGRRRRRRPEHDSLDLLRQCPGPVAGGQGRGGHPYDGWSDWGLPGSHGPGPRRAHRPDDPADQRERCSLRPLHGFHADSTLGLDVRIFDRRRQRVSDHRHRGQHHYHPSLAVAEQMGPFQRPASTSSPATAATISSAPLSVWSMNGALRTSYGPSASRTLTAETTSPSSSVSSAGCTCSRGVPLHRGADTVIVTPDPVIRSSCSPEARPDSRRLWPIWSSTSRTVTSNESAERPGAATPRPSIQKQPTTRTAGRSRTASTALLLMPGPRIG